MRITTYIAALALAVLVSGCSLFSGFGSEQPREAHAVAYNQNAVQSLALGRHYQAAGRFVLARETFLHGLATARDEDLRQTLAAELDATDRLILSDR